MKRKGSLRNGMKALALSTAIAAGMSLYGANTTASGSSDIQEDGIERLVRSEQSVLEDNSSMKDVVTYADRKGFAEPTIPQSKEEKDFLAMLPSSEGDGYKRHPVEQGDTLWGIAREYAEKANSDINGFIDDMTEMNDHERLNHGDIWVLPVRSDKNSHNLSYEDMSRRERIDFLEDRSTPASHDYIEDILDISEKRNMDPRILMSIATVESGFNNGARSSMGAEGIWQLIPAYHGSSEDPMDSLRAAIGFIENLYKDFHEMHGDEYGALVSTIAAYNAGPNRVKGWIEEGKWDGINPEQTPLNGGHERGFSSETRDYVQKNLDVLQDNYNFDYSP